MQKLKRQQCSSCLQRTLEPTPASLFELCSGGGSCTMGLHLHPHLHLLWVHARPRLRHLQQLGAKPYVLERRWLICSASPALR